MSIDATGVRRQAEDGGPAEGRMPYVAMVYHPVPDLPADCPYRPPANAAMRARHLAGLYDLEAPGVQLRKQAGQVGMGRADRWTGLTDGARRLEIFVTTDFPRDVVLILDFWRAADHRTELARLLHPDDEETRKQLLEKWRRLMKHEGGKAVIAPLEPFPMPPRGPAARAKLSETLDYFRNNAHRMDYPTYLANGGLIGSGPVESACKTVVGQRLKLAGMRRREDGADAVCHLRALFKSEPRQWHAFWQRSIN